MIKIINKADCSGCSACYNICPKDAIILEPDSLGFKYPKVKMDRCIDCGLCEKVCSFNEKYDVSLNIDRPEVYAVRHKNAGEVETSRSGAAFSAMVAYTIAKNGSVYGAAFNPDFSVEHKRATTKEECIAFKGSKYVQSDLRGIFRQVKIDLLSGKTVLFSGTPCQTAGLNAYVGKKLRESLILVDVLCHGVPGPQVWMEYLKYLEKKENDKIIYANFRDKRKLGWSAHFESYQTANNPEIKYRRTFSDLFYDHIMLRHSCGNCFFCNTRRPSDITIGDFWGWEKILPEANADNKGLSVLLLNTEKGKMVFEEIENNFTSYKIRIEDCLQPSLQHRIEISVDRDNFERMFEKKGFKRTACHYKALGLPFYVKRFKAKSNTVITMFKKKFIK